MEWEGTQGQHAEDSTNLKSFRGGFQVEEKCQLLHSNCPSWCLVPPEFAMEGTFLLTLMILLLDYCSSDLIVMNIG